MVHCACYVRAHILITLIGNLLQILYYISPSLSWKPPGFHSNIAKKLHNKVFMLFSSSRMLYFL